jgi:hypothetical protein
MSSLSDLVNRARVYAPGCPDSMLQDYLEQAAIEFCRDTWVCYEDVTGVTSADGQVQLISPSGYEVLGVLRAASNGIPIWSQWPYIADNTLSYIDVDTVKQDQPLTFEITGDTLTMKMAPAADTSQSLSWRVAVCPNPGEDDVPDPLVGRWKNAVMFKALENLLILPNQVFTNGGLAQMFGARYATERSKARIETNRGLARNGARMTGPSFTLR